MTPQQLVQFIQARRFPLTSEKPLQAAIAGEFAAAGIQYEREVDLGGGDIIDFMVGGVGIEVKIKGQRRAIYYQCARYCEHAEVQALVLATNAAMGMPEKVNGKPVFIANLGRGWL